MSSSGLHSLATVLKRLEAATSRLEDLGDDLAEKLTGQPGGPAPPRAPVSGSGAAGTPLPPPPPPPPAQEEVPRSVVSFDENVIEAKLVPFLNITKSFGVPSLAEQAGLVEKEFGDLRLILLVAASCQKPDDQAFSKLLDPLKEDIEAITRLKEANRKDRVWFTHLSALAEGAPCAGWVTTPKPGPYISEIKDSAMFYTNRVLKEFKDKDPKHAEWTKSLVTLLEGLRIYVAEFHSTGLTWNPKGVTVDKYSPPGVRDAGAAGVPPPPPPPPPPGVISAPAKPAASVADVMAAINKGEGITSSLRHVPKSEMTHKNPDLRSTSVVPASSPSSPAGKKPIKPAKPQALAGKKPPKFALEGNKWAIEYHENETSLIVDKVEISHIVNLYGCKSSTVQIKGKVNAVNLINCSKTSVLVESVISSVSITNSPSFALQITGSAPTIQIDTTDSGQVYLSKSCLGVEITTAKCSAINISLPVEGEEEGVFEEQPLPEMLKTVIQGGKLVTTIVEHSG